MEYGFTGEAPVPLPHRGADRGRVRPGGDAAPREPYGEAQFSWQTGPLFVTPVAVIEDDLAAFAQKGEELVRQGAKRFAIRRRRP
jgi:hypothetical protein